MSSLSVCCLLLLFTQNDFFCWEIVSQPGSLSPSSYGVLVYNVLLSINEVLRANVLMWTESVLTGLRSSLLDYSWWRWFLWTWTTGLRGASSDLLWCRANFLSQYGTKAVTITVSVIATSRDTVQLLMLSILSFFVCLFKSRPYVFH